MLFWRHSINTLTEQNTFFNVDRAVAYGLDNTTPYFDHAGGAIRNNFVYLVPGLMSSSRTASSDGSLIAWNSPGTQIDNNRLLLNSNEFSAVEFRFSTTTNGTARNILADAPTHLRDSASAYSPLRYLGGCQVSIARNVRQSGRKPISTFWLRRPTRLTKGSLFPR